MPKAAKYLLIGIAALLVILGAGAAFIAATFDPNDYKPQIIALVKEKQQRTLTIPGDIKLRFFPKIGADLGRVAISERNSDAQFASVERVSVSLALMPLLSKQLIVDRVEVKGLNANLRRARDGSTNFDDLMSKESADGSSGQQIRFDIDGVNIEDARIAFDDQMAQRKLEISALKLQTGRLANTVPSSVEFSARVKSSNPVIDANVDLKTRLTFDLDAKRYAVAKIDGEITGAAFDVSDLKVQVEGNADLQPESGQFDIAGLKLVASGKQSGQPLEIKLDAPKLLVGADKVSGSKLSAEAKLATGSGKEVRNLNVQFALPSFEGSRQSFQLPAVLLVATVKDAAGTDAKASVEGSVAGDLDKMVFTSPRLNATLSGKQGATVIDGTISTAVNANLKSGQIDLPGIVANASLPNPGGGAMKLNANGRVLADLNKKNANATLQGRLDESNFDAKLGLTSFSPAAYNFDVQIDKLDADRYRAKPVDGAKPAEPAKPAGKAAEEAEKPIDLSALRELKANGNLRVGELKAQNVRLSNLKLALKADNGKVDVNPINANLYGGTVAGSASLRAAERPDFALRQTLTNVNLGPLLKDAIGKDPVEGRGNVALDVATEGTLVKQLKKNLAGTARVELRDGAVKGFNIGQAIRTAKSRIGELRGDAEPQSGTGNTTEKTDFSELSASFKIARGVAHNDDLRAKSPLLRVDGSGDVDIGEDRLDYLVKATVVSTLQGQGGPELQALKGLTIPVRLTGPLTSIGYKVDFSGVASGLVKKQLDERKDEIKGKVEEQLKDQLKGLFKR